MSERLQISRTLSLEPSFALRMCLKIFADFFRAQHREDSEVALKGAKTVRWYNYIRGL